MENHVERKYISHIYIQFVYPYIDGSDDRFICLCLCRVALDDSGMGILDKAIYVEANSLRRETTRED